jgi:hypothetical protein
MIQVERLNIYRLHSNDLLSDILSVVRPNLKHVTFRKTSVNIESAATILDFISRFDRTELERIDCSLMPPNFNEYLLSSQFHGSLIWPHLDQPLEFFSSSSLTQITYDGGVFGTSSITSHHIATFSQMPMLGSLDLRYCFDNVHPTSFSSLANCEDNWTSLRYLDVKYEFGDPNWESEQIDQLLQALPSSTMKIDPDSRPGYLSMSWGPGSLSVTFVEGGDQLDN